MTARNDYQLNSTLRFTGTFTNDVGTPLDPDAVTVVVSNILDDYSQVSYVFGTDPEITNPVAGSYVFEAVFAADGIYDVTMTGTKDGNTVQAYAEFGIRPG